MIWILWIENFSELGFNGSDLYERTQTGKERYYSTTTWSGLCKIPRGANLQIERRIQYLWGDLVSKADLWR